MELWTGLVCLVANPDYKDFRRFGDGKGAYVHVVAWAESRSHFEARVKGTAEQQLDCILREIEDVDLLETKMQGEGYPEEFLDMRTTANRQRNDVVFGTFHTWLGDDVN
jgi:hypothetical protein